MLILGGCFIDGGEGGGFGGYERLNARLLARPTGRWLSGRGGLSAYFFVFLEVFFSLFFLGGWRYMKILWHYFGMLFLPLRVTSEG